MVLTTPLPNVSKFRSGGYLQTNPRNFFVPTPGSKIPYRRRCPRTFLDLPEAVATATVPATASLPRTVRAFAVVSRA